MVSIPAICDNCGRMFPSGFGMSGGSEVLMLGNKSGPCPYCGAMGSVPNGLYRQINNVINYIADSNYSLEELVQLKNILVNGVNSNMSFEALTEETEKVGFGLKDLFPKNREEARTDIKWFIGLVISVLSILIPVMINQHNDNENIDSEVTAEKVIEYIYNNPEEFKNIGVGDDD